MDEVGEILGWFIVVFLIFTIPFAIAGMAHSGALAFYVLGGFIFCVLFLMQ